MKTIQIIKVITMLVAAAALTACGSKLTITNVNFAQPFEVVAQADDSGKVSDQRTGLSFSVSEFLKNENISQADFTGTELRIIRNYQGCYFVTAPGFKNVYVMKSDENQLKSVNIIRVDANGLSNPAFNQRSPFIQLVDGGNAFDLTKDGIN